MLYALILSSMLSQGQVSAAPTELEMEHHDVLGPIQVIPTRTLRKNIISAEAGFNGLSDLGLLYTRNVVPHFAFDLGAGVARRGGEFGVRGRYNLLTNTLTPFIGLGVMYGTGLPDPIDFKKRDSDEVKYSAKIDRSPMVQGTVGLSWQNRQGFSLMGMLGWTQLLRARNVKVISGDANDSERDRLKVVFSSAPTVALNIGYAF